MIFHDIIWTCFNNATWLKSVHSCDCETLRPTCNDTFKQNVIKQKYQEIPRSKKNQRNIKVCRQNVLSYLAHLLTDWHVWISVVEGWNRGAWERAIIGGGGHNFEGLPSTKNGYIYIYAQCAGLIMTKTFHLQSNAWLRTCPRLRHWHWYWHWKNSTINRDNKK